MNRNSIDRRAAKWLMAGSLALGAAACASHHQSAHEAATGASATSSQTDMAIGISDEFRRQCQLPNSPREAPRFEPGQATLPAQSRSVLDDVANCLSQGPLEGRAILLIGRADARGTVQQNEQLARERAQAALDYLASHGVARNNMRVIATGEYGAQGRDPAGRALDRRVDIELVANGVALENASPSPIVEGTRMQAASPGNDFAVDSASQNSDANAGAKPAKSQPNNSGTKP